MPSSEDLRSDLKILRLTLMRELETINQYQDFFDSAASPAVKELMGHLMFEEKEHVAELTEMLKRLDPDQFTHFEGTHAADIGRGRMVDGGAPLSDEATNPVAANPLAANPVATNSVATNSVATNSVATNTVAATSPLTVGSLLGLPQS